jgi:hypothetical protein
MGTHDCFAVPATDMLGAPVWPLHFQMMCLSGMMHACSPVFMCGLHCLLTDMLGKPAPHLSQVMMCPRERDAQTLACLHA